MTAAPRRMGRVLVLSERRMRREAPTQGAALDDVLGDRTLGVQYQPIAARDRRGWRVIAAEALVRGYSPRGAVLRPDRLLPVVARAGLMDQLFMYVLAEALASTCAWERAGRTLQVAVNLHAGALLDDALPPLVAGLLDAAGLAPGRLTLELTEAAPLRDLRRAATNLRRLRAAGIRVALDDFGAGFSTHTRLAWLQCDELKIDRALVLGLEHCDEQRCVVESLVQVAHSRGMAVCAEGVETAAALELLQSYGVDRVQGWLVGRPADAAALPGLAAGWSRCGAGVDDAARQLSLPGLAGLGFAGA